VKIYLYYFYKNNGFPIKKRTRARAGNNGDEFSLIALTTPTGGSREGDLPKEKAFALYDRIHREFRNS
jgi:hypothetical protein